MAPALPWRPSRQILSKVRPSISRPLCGRAKRTGADGCPPRGDSRALVRSPACSREVLLPNLRGDHPAARSLAPDRAWPRRPDAAGRDRLRQVLHASAAASPEPSLRARRRCDRGLDSGRLDGRCQRCLEADRGDHRGPRFGGATPPRRRHARSGLGQRQDKDGAIMDGGPRRQAVRWPRSTGCLLRLLAGSQWRAPGSVFAILVRYHAGGCLCRLQQAVRARALARSDPGGRLLGALAAQVLRHRRAQEGADRRRGRNAHRCHLRRRAYDQWRHALATPSRARANDQTTCRRPAGLATRPAWRALLEVRDCEGDGLWAEAGFQPSPAFSMTVVSACRTTPPSVPCAVLPWAARTGRLLAPTPAVTAPPRSTP